jgi:selenide,water dikinase
MDDAALLHPFAKQVGSLVFTLDVITPIVDDPLAFGRIAAANSLSDVYAMGGTPQVALSFAGLPDSLGLDGIKDVLYGMAEKAQEASCAIVGGHTIKDTEPKCGLVVIGSVDPDEAWTHKRAQAGQTLVLTKPIGTGVLAQSLRGGHIQPQDMADAVEAMQTLNAQACTLGRKYGATAATDVTGFGLLGHLYHMASASGLEVVLHTNDVPLFAGAYDAAKAGHVPGGTKRNAAYVHEHLEGLEDIDHSLLMLLADAQTSGGLLLALDDEPAQQLCQEMPGATIIGKWKEGTAGTIRLVS